MICQTTLIKRIRSRYWDTAACCADNARHSGLGSMTGKHKALVGTSDTDDARAGS